MKLNLASPASGSDAIRQDAPVGRTLRPAIPIHDERFKYTPSHLTNIRERFDRIRAAMNNVKPLRKRS